MINKQQATDGVSIEPGGHQSRINTTLINRPCVEDAHIIDPQLELGKNDSQVDKNTTMSTQSGSASNYQNWKMGSQSDDMIIEESSQEQREVHNRNLRSVHNQSPKTISYKDAFLNSDSRWRNCFQEWGLKEVDVYLVRETTTAPADVEVDDGVPSIKLDIDIQKRIIQPWKYCLIGKVVGKMVGYKYLSFKINELWKLSGKFIILDLGCDFFLYKFENPDDCRFALLEGPWFINGHHLSMRRWSPNFKPSEASVNTTVVWARLPELPLEYFDKDVLEKVGEKIGRLIKVYNTTDLILRGKFARVCVEVSTDQLLVPFVRIGSVKQKVEYEGVKLVCFHCGKMSHRKENCPLNVKDSNIVVNSEDVSNIVKMPNNDSKSDLFPGIGSSSNAEESFGPWMLVDKKKNKAKGAGARVTSRKDKIIAGGCQTDFLLLMDRILLIILTTELVMRTHLMLKLVTILLMAACKMGKMIGLLSSYKQRK